MPKVRKERTRRHASAAGASVYERPSATGPTGSFFAKGAGTSLPNPFMLGSQAEPPARPQQQHATATEPAGVDATAEAGEAVRKVKMSKKTKKHMRHKRFMSRLMLPGDSAKFKRKSIGDMQSLTDFLPSAEESVLIKLNNRGKNLTQHTRKEIATTEIQQFTNVLSHPAFRNNPLAALRAHLTNSQDQERDNQKKLNAIAGVKPQRKQKKKTKKK